MCWEWKVNFYPFFLYQTINTDHLGEPALEQPSKKLRDSLEQWHINCLLNHRAIIYVTNILSLYSLHSEEI